MQAPKLTFSQVLCVCVQAFRNLEMAAVFGFTSKALLSMSEDPDFEMNDEQASWIGAAVPLTALLGSLAAGKFIDVFGRKRVSLITEVPSLLAWICIAMASTPFEVVIGRLLNGFCLGVQQVCTTVYVSETVHSKLRPVLGIIPAITVTLGFILMNLSGIYSDWRGMAWYGASSGLPLFLLLILLPETPYYALKSGNKNEARGILTWLRATEDEVHTEMIDLEQSLKTSFTKESVKFQDLFIPPYRWPILMAIILHITQQTTGMSSIMSFTGIIYKESNSAVNTNVSSMVTSVITLVTLIYISRRFAIWPRKYFLKVGAICMVAGLLALAFFFWLRGTKVLENKEVNISQSYVPFICISLISLGFCFGWAPIPWMFIGESFPLKMRGIGAGFITSLNWGVNFVVTKTFIWATKHWGYHIVFLMYAFITSCGTLLLMKNLPETFSFSDTKLEKYYRNMYKIKIK